MRGTAITVALNFDRLQTSCLKGGREGVGDRLELWRERAQPLKTLCVCTHARTHTHTHTSIHTHSLSLSPPPPWPPPSSRLHSWTTWSEVIVLTVSAKNRSQVSTTWACSFFLLLPPPPHHPAFTPPSPHFSPFFPVRQFPLPHPPP